MDIKIKKNHNHKSIFIIACIFLVSLTIAFNFIYEDSTTLSTDDVWIETIKLGDVSIKRSGHGQIKASHSKWVITSTGGFIESIHKRPGSWVQKGELLLELNNIELTLQYQQAKEMVLEKQSELKSLIAQLKGEEIRSLNQIRKIKAELGTILAELEAYKKLRAIGVTSEIEYQKKQSLVKNTKERLTSEKEYHTQLSLVHEAKIEAMKAKIERQQHEVDLITQNIANLKLRAPESGILNRISEEVELGKNIPPNSSLFEITDAETFFAEIEISYSVAKDIKKGMLATIEFSDELLEGVVDRIDPRANGGQVIVDIVPTSPFSRNVMVGQPVTASISIQTLKNAHYITNTSQAAVDNRVFKQGENNLFTYISTAENVFGMTSGDIRIVNGDFHSGEQIALLKHSISLSTNEFILK